MGNKKTNVFRQEAMAHIVALRDISYYLLCQDTKIIDENKDVWMVTPTRMFNKESRLLNNKLGLHKVNKQRD